MVQVVAEALPFGRWLIEQRHRSDAVGTLAKQAHLDPKFPRTGDPRAVSKRLNEISADGDMHRALEDAELDWASY